MRCAGRHDSDTSPSTRVSIQRRTTSRFHSTSICLLLCRRVLPICLSAEEEEHRRRQNDLLERHTSAAKDGVIEMLTDEASKLGGSLERAMLAKKEVEDRVDKLQVGRELLQVFVLMVFKNIMLRHYSSGRG